MTILKFADKKEKESGLIIHPNFDDILYENSREVKNIFYDINGTYEINYFALYIISPNMQTICLSSAPNIEFNLINKDLYKHDLSFNLDKINEIIWWDENINSLYWEKIKQIKLKNNDFQLGFNINRKIEDFYFLYCFATKSEQKNLKKYYKNNLAKLINLGDFFFKLTRKIYYEYSFNYKFPELQNFSQKSFPKSHLKLIGK